MRNVSPSVVGTIFFAALVFFVVAVLPQLSMLGILIVWFSIAAFAVFVCSHAIAGLRAVHDFEMDDVHPN